SAPISTMLNTRVHQSEVSMATEALLQRLAAVRGRLSLCAPHAAASKLLFINLYYKNIQLATKQAGFSYRLYPY
ncbi:hypothetical protein ACVGV4_10040, partial [Enterobacter hormaechei]